MHWYRRVHGQGAFHMNRLSFDEADLKRTLRKYGLTLTVFHAYNGEVVEITDGTLGYELDAVRA